MPDSEHAPPPRSADVDAPDPSYPFDARELARLRVFRAAIDAGFYSDGLGPTLGHSKAQGDSQSDDAPQTG
jgi:hypothetical protein